MKCKYDVLWDAGPVDRGSDYSTPYFIHELGCNKHDLMVQFYTVKKSKGMRREIKKMMKLKLDSDHRA